MKKTKKLQKPIDKDLHLKYRCKKCGLDHWLSFREASTKDFKVVCTCGKIFKVKQVCGLSIRYKSNESKQKTEKPESESQVTPQDTVVSKEDSATFDRKTIPVDLLEKSVKLLLSYGFTKTEATQLVTNTYLSVPVDDYAILVKYTLQTIGDSDYVSNTSSTL